jgi:hypothetical protein
MSVQEQPKKGVYETQPERTGYQDQLKRAYRWLARLESKSTYSTNDINNPLPLEDLEEYEDFLYALFQNCWHVKDWILSDSSAPKTLKDAVRRVVEEGAIDALMLCADVANGSKHVSGPKPRRDAKRGAKTIGEIEIEIGGDNAKTTYTYKVSDDSGNSYDAIAVARQALKEWEGIIAESVAAANTTPSSAQP